MRGGLLAVMANRTRSVAAQLVDAGRWRVSAADKAARFAERDARLAADDRSEAQRFLGDPPRDRSALAQASTPATAPQRGKAWRVDLWRK